ncbi:MAG: histidine phosphatase family protein [Planctomycetaceae bacterium]|nr:histidine phosphatase family protein [Planctomycetaceae bacterium]MBV8678030.1 histidine phosphatase family protein [Planctomycetaceae bacterium]
MPETRVLLLRHAETSAPDRFHGAESDVGLGERGRRQAEAVAEILAAEGPDALYSSAMRRALETAAPIGRAAGLVPRVVEALHERAMGPLSGLRREEGLDTYVEAKRRWMAGDLDFTHEGGESFASIRRRVVPALRALARRHPGQTIVVIAHGVVIRVALTSLLEGYGPEDFDRIGIANTGVNDLRTDGERWRAVALNQAPEIATEEPPGPDPPSG